MNRRKFLRTIGLTLLVLLSIRCNAMPTPEPAPTSTPFPTVTLAPTSTPPPTLTPTANPTPTPTPTPIGGGGGQIAFVSNRDGNLEICVINSDGSGQANLTNHESEDNWPTMSPDGKQIAFTSDRDEPNPGSCGLSNSCSSEIYIVNTDGTGLTRLTDDPGQETFPAWSPDGTQIAFVSNRDGGLDVFVMNADGSAQTNLTNTSGFDLYPAWMEDGSQIVFLSTRDGGFQFYVMNADGSEQTMMDSGLPPSESSPGSLNTLFFLEDVSVYEIYALAGDSLKTIEDSGSSLGEFPTWSPDGTQVAFHSNRDGDMEIYVMNADGSEVTQLTDDDANDMFPAWSPDGTRITFHSNRDGNVEIYVMNADGSNVVNLTNNSADDTIPAWYP